MEKGDNSHFLTFKKAASKVRNDILSIFPKQKGLKLDIAELATRDCQYSVLLLSLQTHLLLIEFCGTAFKSLV